MSEPHTIIQRVDPAGLSPALLSQVDAIFFESSGRSLLSAPEQSAFRERWLGRYLLPDGLLFLAIGGRDTVAGYLVGDLDDPARQERFADIGYFRNSFADLCRRFPAHLHINLAAAFRSRGFGTKLIEAFCDHAGKAGVPGVHVVTGRDMRNVGFYARCGFSECGSTEWNGREVVFLAKELARLRP